MERGKCPFEIYFEIIYKTLQREKGWTARLTGEEAEN
jgi:hypothetical protein